MKKKGFMAAIALIALMMLSTLAPVLAAPKEEKDFALYIQGSIAPNSHANGYVVGSPDNKWTQPPPAPLPPPDGYAVMHYIDAPFNPSNVWVVIGEETIPFAHIVYAAEISGNINWLNDKQAQWKVDEKVTIYTDSSKTTVWGTLEMRTLSHDYLSASVGVVVGSFEGHGTGALEGVKVQGDATAMISNNILTRVRDGVAVSWPW
jgi:hypothetical protein